MDIIDEIPHATDQGAGTGKAHAGAPLDEKEALYRLVRDRLASPEDHGDEVQYELARWIHLLETRDVDLKPIPGRSKAAEVTKQLVREAGAAIPSLLSAKPDLVFARTLRNQTEIALLRCNGFGTRWLVAFTGGVPALAAIYGAITPLLLCSAFFVAWLATNEIISQFVPSIPPLIAIATYGGFLGGLVSILVRIRQLSRIDGTEHMVLYFNSCLKPFVGVVFGIFTFSLWQSGLLPLALSLSEAVNGYTVFALAFIAGFSERFVKDLVSRGEGLVPASKTR